MLCAYWLIWKSFICYKSNSFFDKNDKIELIYSPQWTLPNSNHFKDILGKGGQKTILVLSRYNRLTY